MQKVRKNSFAAATFAKKVKSTPTPAIPKGYRHKSMYMLIDKTTYAGHYHRRGKYQLRGILFQLLYGGADVF